jgi:hypothetical protein
MNSLRHFFSLVALCGFVTANVHADELPLFAADEVIDIVFEAPMTTIIRNAEKRPEVEGVMRYTEDDGRVVTLNLKMTTRGKSRLEYCRFPPLKINLKKGETDGTLFTGQNKLKVVTRCREGDAFERYLLQEFSIYGAFNVLTDRSFRVRMLNVTYRDTSGKRKDETHSSYFIETDKEVAARYGMEQRDIDKIQFSKLDPAHTSKLSLFQYLIGNTDWSMVAGPAGAGCCHNNKLIVTPGSENGWILLPYDFDQSGLINTRYSEPSEMLGIRSVRQRVFRGRCSNIDQLDDAIALFNERRGAIEAELLPAALEDKPRKTAAKYIDDFYEIINDPKKLQKNIIGKCIGW